MRQVSVRRVLGIVAVTAMAVPIAAPIASATPASAAHSNQVKAVKKADAQAKKLITKSRSCPVAAKQRAITIKVRVAQTKNLKKAGPTSLRLRQMRISAHAQRLAVALSKCSPSSSSPAQPGSPGSGARGLQGSDGSNGTRIAGIPVDAVDDALDATSILGGGTLPAIISVVDLPGLDTAPCLTSGAVCLGVDRGGIVDTLTAAVRERELELPVLRGVLDPLLAEVDRAFDSSDVSSLVDVQRTGDTTFVVTAAPGSALERLINLLENTGGLPSGSLGTLQVRP